MLPIGKPASRAGAIGYELMCAVTQRVPFTVEEGPALLDCGKASGPKGCDANHARL